MLIGQAHSPECDRLATCLFSMNFISSSVPRLGRRTRVLWVVVPSRRGGVDSMKRIALAILVVLPLAMTANAQTYRGAINGTVTDPSGAVVPNAQVKATEKSTGIDRNTVTTSDGLFAFQDLPTGTYKITVTASGFAVLAVDNILVAQGAIYTLPVKLSLAQGTITQIEVSAAALTLDTTTETQTTLVTGDDLQALPQNGRDFSQMIALAPGFGGYNVGGLGGG